MHTHSEMDASTYQYSQTTYAPAQTLSNTDLENKYTHTPGQAGLWIHTRTDASFYTNMLNVEVPGFHHSVMLESLSLAVDYQMANLLYNLNHTCMHTHTHTRTHTHTHYHHHHQL